MPYRDSDLPRFMVGGPPFDFNNSDWFIQMKRIGILKAFESLDITVFVLS